MSTIGMDHSEGEYVMGKPSVHLLLREHAASRLKHLADVYFMRVTSA
jgi:hypothetical protein